jgi:hypothetical protein
MGNDQGGIELDGDDQDKSSQDHHHSFIQELEKLFNVTIRSTTSMVP